jgi:hypothetical protein
VIFKKTVHWLVVQKLRFERGKSWVAVFQNMALFLLLFQGWGFDIKTQLIFGFATLIILWGVGYLDETRLFGWQKENEYISALNPTIVRIDQNTQNKN